MKLGHNWIQHVANPYHRQRFCIRFASVCIRYQPSNDNWWSFLTMADLWISHRNSLLRSHLVLHVWDGSIYKLYKQKQHYANTTGGVLLQVSPPTFRSPTHLIIDHIANIRPQRDVLPEASNECPVLMSPSGWHMSPDPLHGRAGVGEAHQSVGRHMVVTLLTSNR